MNIVIVHDAIGDNAGHLPPGMAAGYVTGSGSVPWSNADWAAHPGAVRIDQTPAATSWDATADIDDYERGTVTLAELAPRAKARKAAFDAGTRPGQRTPGVYASASNLTDVANALIRGGVTSGVGLWVANWSVTEPQAQKAVEDAAGPFPIIAWQFASQSLYDTSVFSGAWLANVSASPGGSTAHKTVAGDTLGGLAASRNMTIWSWVDLQRKLSAPDSMHLVRHAAPEVGSTWHTE